MAEGGTTEPKGSLVLLPDETKRNRARTLLNLCEVNVRMKVYRRPEGGREIWIIKLITWGNNKPQVTLS